MITFLDTTLRDGEQAPGFSMNVQEKLRLAEALKLLGVDIIEAGFPASSQDDFAAVRAICTNFPSVHISALSRLKRDDIKITLNALSKAKYPHLHLFFPTSQIHLKNKLGLTQEKVLEEIFAAISFAKKEISDIEFSLEDATRTEEDFLLNVIKIATKAGATTINLPDTVGYSTPEEIAHIFSLARATLPAEITLSTHCHNDLGLAVANTLSALTSGATQAECTLGGIGERAGNAALEEVVMALKTRHNHYHLETNIHSEEITRAARTLRTITGISPFPTKPIIGRNAFLHESGIHQHGIIKDASTYQIIDPKSIGRSENDLVLGKHSGHHALQIRLLELGYTFTDIELASIFANFKALTQRKKNITDKDISALAETFITTTNENTQTWTLKNFVVNSGNNMTSTALVTLSNGKKTIEEVAKGSGPIYAIVRAVEKIIHHPFTLEDYQLQSVTEHRDAQGEVVIILKDQKGTYRGRGLSTDIIEASLFATLSAVNRMLT